MGGVYASVFSESSGRIVLDGDMEASPRKEAQAQGDAIANAPRRNGKPVTGDVLEGSRGWDEKWGKFDEKYGKYHEHGFL